MKHLKIISLYHFSESVVEQIKQYASYEYCSNRETQLSQFATCDILLGNPTAAMLAHAKQLKWVQLYSAGSDQYQQAMFPKGCVVTSASGTFGLTISEHLLLYTLSLMRNASKYTLDQQQHRWDPLHKTGLLYGSTFLIVGTGDIGSHYAKAIQALGGYTIGVRRKHQQLAGFHEIHTLDSLDTLLPQADVVVSALPKHLTTNHVFATKQFSLMKPDSIFLNVGRSNVLDIDALVTHLKYGPLKAAHLDVFDEEPLPINSNLWDVENLIITPHVSGTFANPITRQLYEQLVLENIERFFKGEALRKMVDF